MMNNSDGNDERDDCGYNVVDGDVGYGTVWLMVVVVVMIVSWILAMIMVIVMMMVMMIMMVIGDGYGYLLYV